MINRVKTLLLFATLILSVLVVPGCVEKRQSYVRNDKEYGITSGSFRGRWWNYYERGRSFSDGRFYKEAIEDFHKAIAGREQDQWRARTYGMHFVDYFPHRELGIVYYQRKEISKAIEELEISVTSAPSAKAHYFLNKARAAQIIQEQRDRLPPELHLESEEDEEITNRFTTTITGVAKDDNYVAAIKVGDSEIMIELAKQRKIFNQEVPLSEGENRIKVAVSDLAGKTTEKTVYIFCDRRGPQIVIEDLNTKDSIVTIRGNVTDNKGLLSLEINNTPWPITGDSLGENFKVAVPEGKITITARDKAGNLTKAVIHKGERNNKNAARRYPLLASLRSNYFLNSANMVVSDVSPQLFTADTTGVPDTEPPYIQLVDLAEEQETYDDMVLIEGQVSDMSRLTYMTLNGNPILNRKGMKIYFSVLHKLQEGNNEFRLTVTDEYGNTAAKTITVMRKIQKIRQIGSRMSIAVLPFEQKGEKPGMGDIIHDQMIDSFLEQKRFNIVERNKLDTVLRELQLSGTELVNPQKAVKLGKIVAAQTLLAGSVIESPESIEIIGRLIDTETATILASNDIFGEDKGFGSLDNLLDGLAFKFKRDFPVVEGILLEVRDNEVLIDIGGEKSIKPNVRLFCYREGVSIKHPVTGKILGSEPQILGMLKVEQVYEDFSKAAILDREGEMIVSDKVIVQ